jgi:carbamoyltransferase
LLLPYINPLEVTSIVYNWLHKNQIEILRKIFINVIEWKPVFHHISHVWSAYMFTDPQENDLIVSIDGGGDLEDYFHIYHFMNGEVNELKEIKVNLGKAYRVLGILSPELNKNQSNGYQMDLALSGKKMSLLSFGTVVDEYKKPLEEFYYDFMLNYDEINDSIDLNLSILLSKIGFANEKFLNQETSRDLMATSQYVFEKIIQKYLYPFLLEQKYKRVIMVGGCALNVTMNSKIIRDFNIEVFTPPCPNDCGISLGAAKIYNPKLKLLKTPFTFFPPSGNEMLAIFEKTYFSKFVTLDELALIIANGAIVGTMIGSLEIGPRALGNRSYLANPLILGMKNKMNSDRIKNREFWRPVAPIVALEKLDIYFDTKNPSPYMTFAPFVKKEYTSLLKEITHIDGTARVQTVSKESGWIYNLIKAFGKISGVEMLMNTSFNQKGHPLINDFYEAFNIFKDSDLDCIVISEKEPNKNDKVKIFIKNNLDLDGK